MQDNVKEIPSFSDYSISKDGRVRANWGRKKWLFGTTTNGYPSIGLFRDGIKHAKFIHSLLLETYVCGRPENMECRHLDGNRQNNNLSNLKWGTHEENMQDNVRNGVCPTGENQHAAKLTEQDVKLIIDAYYDGAYNMTQLANHFDVSVSVVSGIIGKKSWACIWKQLVL